MTLLGSPLGCGLKAVTNFFRPRSHPLLECRRKNVDSASVSARSLLSDPRPLFVTRDSDYLAFNCATIVLTGFGFPIPCAAASL